MKLIKIIINGFQLFLILLILLIVTLIFPLSIFAEDKSAPGGIIPKLPKTPNDPQLFNNFVYPSWGIPCQRYTYSVSYKDKEGRSPTYVKIYFNGKMIDMDPTSPKALLGKKDFQKGVRYEYKFVPNKLGSNFYYFEASNGLGKTRASIIDSPDNGPVLFESAFNKNEIAVVDVETGKKILSYPTKEEWIGGIALSDDGKYLAAKTSKHIYLFDTTKPKEPLWNFVCEQCQIGDDVKGGIAISGDGSKIIAAFGEKVAFFDKTSKKPLWISPIGNSYNAAISKDGKYVAAATAGEESNINSNLLILWDEKGTKLWQYHSSGNFHDVSLSDDGKYIAGSTGCPDRKAYLFSRDSNDPLIKTDSLTRDSPVHRAKVSADGSMFAVGSEADAGAIFLFSKDSITPVWKFPTTSGSSVRALSYTSNGQFIGAATFGGQAYIFSKESNQPIATWYIPNIALGGIDIAEDGSFIVVGGTDNKVHILDKNSKTDIKVSFDEYIEEIDISANKKYAAVGTGGSIYFFETFAKNENKIFPCTTVIEPKPMEQAIKEAGIDFASSQNQNRPTTQETSIKKAKLPGMLFGFGFYGSVLVLGFYLGIIKFNIFRNHQKTLLKRKRKVVITFTSLAIMFFVLTIISIICNNSKQRFSPIETPQTTPQKQKYNIGNKENDKRQTAVCGNDFCEPDLGESKTTCPNDCSAGD